MKFGEKEINIFVTGGTGFFGKNLLLYVNQLNFNRNKKIFIRILSRDPDNFIKKYPGLINIDYVSFIKGDVREFNFTDDYNYDYVIHGATEASAKLERENPEEMYSVVVDGTKNLLKQIAGRVDRLLFISSGGVYGEQPSYIKEIPENFPCNPVTAYGRGKLKAEELCVNSGISTSIARCFTFVGPYLPLDAHFAIGNFILNCLKNEPIIINSDGRAIRSYMYSEDLIEWLIQILIRGESGEVYNVGSDVPITIAGLAEIVNESFNDELFIDVLGKNIKGASNRYIPTVKKANKKLGLTLKNELKVAIKKTIEFIKENQLED